MISVQRDHRFDSAGAVEQALGHWLGGALESGVGQPTVIEPVDLDDIDSLRKALVMDYQVAIAVRQFEKTPDGSVVLNARWTILDNDKKELVLRRSEYTQLPADADYVAQAAAQSQLLGRLSEEIAAAMLELQRDGGPSL